MSKLTPKEIKKALECCGLDDCRECPCYTEELGCDHNLELLALDLLNQYEAKIKALEMDNEQLKNDIINAEMNLNHAQAEIDMIKSEAVREFAAQVKKRAYRNSYGEILIFGADIDNLVEEMVGEGNEPRKID